ncbi:hypothetical protein KP509_01G017400 [Ceratopteris richardii]|uniref:Oxidation resistance protein 1 n=1 Tax=Ceratopteris richardii TaxID=49495 RepID=A0A8T2VE20_CERRI|nr:hypothetical protein KP509_01G017400 [Ceratopteris richardii]KAH7445602.1 hypothetical protein KP509_01G017400 [Ceratopteris richardii]
MKRRKYHSTWPSPSPPKKGSGESNGTPDNLMSKLHAQPPLSFRAFLRSFFSCTGSGVFDCGDDPPVYDDNLERKPVAPPVKKPEAKKKNTDKHSISKLPQVQHEGAIALVRTEVKTLGGENGVLANGNSPCPVNNQTISLPGISEPSTILSESLRSLLFTHLPTLAKGREWVLLYSTWKHGISLRTLYRRSSHLSGPCLLAVEDKKGGVFGGLMLAPLNPTPKPKFQGTHESFVFTAADTNLGVFGATGSNRYYYICTNDMLALGAGGTFALKLDGDLMHGTSGQSETYGNCCLSKTQEFYIKHVELWGFAHTSKYVPDKARYQPPEERIGFCSYS